MKRIANFILFALISSVGSLSVYGDVATTTAKNVTITSAWQSKSDVDRPPSYASNGNTGQQWCTAPANNGASYYGNPNALPVQMIFDLGTDQAISELQFWNYQYTGNDIKDFTLRVSSSSAGLAGLSDSKTLKLTAAQLDQTHQQNFNISTLTDDVVLAGGGVRYIELTVNTNYDGDRVGLADMRFVVGKTIPNNVTGVDDKTDTNAGSNLKSLIDGNSGSQWYTIGRGDFFNGLPATEYPKLTFDMGISQTLSGIKLNNYSVSGNRMKDFTLEFLDASGNIINNGEGTPIQLTQQAAWQDQNTTQSIDFGQEIPGVRSVRMTISSNWIEKGSGGDRVGFAEISMAPVATLSTAAAAAEIVAKPVEFLKADTITPVGVKDYHGVGEVSLGYLIDGDKATNWYTIAHGQDDYYSVFNAPVLTFDLGGTHTLSGLSLWGYSDNQNQMRDFRLNFLDATGNFIKDENGNWLEEAFVLNFDRGAKTEQEFGFEVPVEAAYVMLTALDNYYGYGVGNGGDRVGFAEIAFHTLPEPGTVWLLMISVLVSTMVFRNGRRHKNAKTV